MAYTLADLYKKNSDLLGGTNQSYGIKNYSLPNNGGGYSAVGTTTPGGMSKPVPAGANMSFVGGGSGVVPPPTVVPPPKVIPPPVKKPVFTGTTTPTSTFQSKLINPDTGAVWTDQEYADMMAAKARGTNTDIGAYAGGQITDPNQSAADLTNQGRVLNNVANDIATGTTDPYGVASQSGIQYTPQELKAIESAYAGIYDPVLNDVFTKLDVKKKADDQALADKTWKEQQNYSTNESIRQYNATTGANQASDKAKGTYIIQPGDDLRTIAAKKGLTYESLQAVNPAVDELNLKPGQEITLPQGGTTASTALTKTAAQTLTDAMWEFLGTPEAQAMDNTQKAQIIMKQKLNPADFNISYY